MILSDIEGLTLPGDRGRRRRSDRNGAEPPGAGTRHDAEGPRRIRPSRGVLEGRIDGMTEPTQLHALADGELDTPGGPALSGTPSRPIPKRCRRTEFAILNLKEASRHPERLSPTPIDEVMEGLRRAASMISTRLAAWRASSAATPGRLCGALFLFILSGRVAMRNVQGDSVPYLRHPPLRSLWTPPSTRPRRSVWSRMHTSAILNDGGSATSIAKADSTASEPVVRLASTAFSCRAQFPLRDREGDLVLTDAHRRRSPRPSRTLRPMASQIPRSRGRASPDGRELHGLAHVERPKPGSSTRSMAPVHVEIAQPKSPPASAARDREADDTNPTE